MKEGDHPRRANRSEQFRFSRGTRGGSGGSSASSTATRRVSRLPPAPGTQRSLVSDLALALPAPAARLAQLVLVLPQVGHRRPPADRRQGREFARGGVTARPTPYEERSGFPGRRCTPRGSKPTRTRSRRASWRLPLVLTRVPRDPATQRGKSRPHQPASRLSTRITRCVTHLLNCLFGPKSTHVFPV